LSTNMRVTASRITARSFLRREDDRLKTFLINPLLNIPKQLKKQVTKQTVS
jgi:hypothetical protein